MDRIRVLAAGIAVTGVAAGAAVYAASGSTAGPEPAPAQIAERTPAKVAAVAMPKRISASALPKPKPKKAAAAPAAVASAPAAASSPAPAASSPAPAPQPAPARSPSPAPKPAPAPKQEPALGPVVVAPAE